MGWNIGGLCGGSGATRRGTGGLGSRNEGGGQGGVGERPEPRAIVAVEPRPLHPDAHAVEGRLVESSGGDAAAQGVARRIGGRR